MSDLIHDLLAIVKGFRNGIVYGAKIRLPHALVMTLLFKSGTWMEKVQWIVDATKQHAWNLGRFVAIYKTVLLVLKLVIGSAQGWHSFVAGCVGGHFIFSQDNPVNNQIVMYLWARVTTSLIKLAVANRVTGNWGFHLQAVFVWGAVMWLFQHHRPLLQSSLQASMQYLYLDSEHFDSLWNLLIFNKYKSD